MKTQSVTEVIDSGDAEMDGDNTVIGAILTPYEQTAKKATMSIGADHLRSDIWV